MLQLKKVFCGNPKNSLTKYMFITISLGIILLGCGGGGSDGGGGTTSGGDITYSGQTSPAAIDTNNAQEIAAEAYKGMQAGESMNPFSGLQVAESPAASGRPIAIDLYETMEDILIRADIPQRNNYGTAAVQTESDTLDDDCGGTNTATYTITLDDVTGVFSGRFTFNNFCSDSSTFTGSATFSGVVNVSGGGELFNSFLFSFDNLTLSSNGTSFTLDGDLAYISTSGMPTVTLDMYLKDNVSGEVAWIDDYRLIYNNQYVDISGTFYHHSHGRVTLVTDQDLYFGYGQEYPSTGVMIFTGAPGSSGGNAKVRIQAISSSSCHVTADIDGDGLYDDFDSGVILWTAIDD